MAPIQIPQDLMIDVALNPTFIATFTLFIALLLVGTIGIGKLCKRFFNLPIIAGQILGGIVLGPSLLDISHWNIFKLPLALMDHASQQVFVFLSADIFLLFVCAISSAITVAYLLWVAGYETDIKDMMKVGVTATSAGFLGAIMPIIMIVSLAYVFFPSLSLVMPIGLGLIFSATSVSIPVAMLVAQQKMHLRTSKATLGAAIIDDILAVLFLSLFMVALQTGLLGKAISLPGVHTASLGVSLGKMVIAFVVLFVVGYKLLPKISEWLQKAQYAHLIAPFALCMMLFYFSFAELFGGLAGITGAYFAGLFHRKGDGRHRAERTLSPFINAILLPLFLGSIGLQVNLQILTLVEWLWVVGLLLIAIFSKLIGTYMAIGLSNLSGRRGNKKWSLLEGYIFGASMVARGEVGLVVATILRGTQLIPDSFYVISVVVIVLTTIATPIMLSIGFSMQEQRKAEPKEAHDDEAFLGNFAVIGNSQMFNIIASLLEHAYHIGTAVSMSEGHRILDLEGKKVRIVLTPERGIYIKGEKGEIEQILTLVSDSLRDELSRMPRQVDAAP
ncbi:TPA: hypothetical protein DIC20_02230 [Candidatus Dependentiae bacterium]|nr:MAG: Sodium/hydrogen exchanger [candidate division TM6 bacterium GW2011_GWF2_36_131]KKQ03326.1 MAG: Sodium/hydrogen exchanger [candidate division TM6 bacterium GW2011_GWE2_36_25]KKQ19722.1 MAG: Sodium/hydrogen exchanger [candidate division TM6 bacterium GW2011_GWA2_36_9]HBR70895.1 hypothetical protein [Candidatus Dependentiae bacterium]HCU00502.1 hypothetical protein [Candidatus Dependentiae bacterium]